MIQGSNPFFCLLTYWLGIFFIISPIPAFAQNRTAPELICQTPVLSRLQRHRLAPGETVASIAQQHNLLPETLLRLNPVLQGASIPVGQEILIPPFNGIRLEAPSGATWQDLAKAYGVRADILFEINGCQKNPKIVFIPGVTWTANNSLRPNNYTGLASYPLANVAKVGLAYGWHKNATTGQAFFHSGIDLLVAPGTSVLAAETGTVVFVGQEGTYGNLVVLEHSAGRQTRYAHLSQIQVKIGQKVNTGDVLGAVGMTGRPDVPEPHLHFEVRYKLPVGWVAQDPTIHLKLK